MQKTVIAIMFIVSAIPAFAQRYPFPTSCQVAAIDRYNRVVAYFQGRTHPGSGMCREGLRRCNQEIRRRGWYDLRCVQLRERRW